MTQQLPAPIEIRAAAAKAAMERNLVFRPTSDEILNAWITVYRANGQDFGAWTPDADAAFRARRTGA